MTEKRYMVIQRHGARWSYCTHSHELFDADGAAKYASTIPAKYEPRVVTAAEYLRIVQGFKDAA